MVDIHSHILWGLDDGSGSLEESVALIEQAAAHGTTDIVATPHASPEYRFDPDAIALRLEQLRGHAPESLRLHSGADFHMSHDNIEDALRNPRKYTIAQRRYLLVEFSDLVIFRNTEQNLRRLMDAGMTPVVTHPERNPLLRQRIGELARWVELGCRLQVTGSSLLDRFGNKAQRFAEKLIEGGLVHFLASDAHHPVHRPARLDEAYAAVARKYGQELAEALCVGNPRAALAGDPIESPGGVKRRGLISRWFR